MLRNGDVLTAALMTALFGGLAAYALTLSPAARLMPLVVGVPGLVFSLAQLLIAFRNGTEARIATRAEIKAFAWIAGFIGAILLLGFTAGAPLAVAAYLRFAAEENWKIAAAGGVACFALVYGLFDRLLSAHLYDGVVSPW